MSLKKPEKQDLEFIRKLWSDPRTMEAVGGPVQLTDDLAIQWFERMVDPGCSTDCYRLIVDEAGNPVGEVSYHRLDQVTMTAELNIKILFSQRGMGYAKAALREFLDFFFYTCRGRCVTDDVALENENGQNFLMSFGFLKDPTVHDVCKLAMTRERYAQLYRGARL